MELPFINGSASFNTFFEGVLDIAYLYVVRMTSFIIFLKLFIADRFFG
jgi:uncharacterized membrane protein required for colicin V production